MSDFYIMSTFLEWQDPDGDLDVGMVDIETSARGRSAVLTAASGEWRVSWWADRMF